jgi:hypothetical protein
MTEQPVGMLLWESLRDTIPGPHVSGKTVIVGHAPQKGGEILGDQGACVIAKSYEMKAAGVKTGVPDPGGCRREAPPVEEAEVRGRMGAVLP